jgi:hypothetical protein
MKTVKITLLAVAFFVFAAGISSAAIIMTVDSPTIFVGATATINVSLSGNPASGSGQAYAFDFTIPYNSSNFSVSNLLAGPAVSGMTLGLLTFDSTKIQVSYFNAPISNGALAHFDVTGLTPGVYALNLSPAGVYDSFGDDIVPAFQKVNGTLTVNAVPIPAAVWLLGSGLVGLVAIRRRMRK